MNVEFSGEELEVVVVALEEQIKNGEDADFDTTIEKQLIKRLRGEDEELE